MLASYGSRDGVLQALEVLAGTPVSDELREQVIEDTLHGAPEAKRVWTDRGVIEDVSAGLDAVTVPVSILVGSRDRIEHESALREIFGRLLPPLRKGGGLVDAPGRGLVGANTENPH